MPQIAVVGCGYWGQNLVRVFNRLGALRAICEPSVERKDLACRIAPVVPIVDEFETLLEDPHLDAVVVATPAETHARLARQALEAGKHVFVEKPLALKVEEAEALVSLAASRRKILMVGHVLQYHPAIVKLKELIDVGELGKIQYLNSSRLNFGKVRTEENILWSFAPHDISVILMLLHEFPAEVKSFGGYYLQRGVEDVTLTMLDFVSGVKAHIFVSWMHPFKEQQLVVIGSKKTAVFDDVSKEKLSVYPHTIEWRNRAPVALKAERQVIPIEAEEPLFLECRHFLHCIQNGVVPQTDGEEGLRVLRVLAASEASLRHSAQAVAPNGKSAPGFFVHPTSCVDENVLIGEGTKIWHFSHILSHSRIGKNCIIGQNVAIGPEVEVGNGVKIQNNVSVYKGVKIEDSVFCGPAVVFTNVINPRSEIERKHEFRPTLIKRGATLGANATILCGITIGEYAFVAAGAVVTKDVPAYGLVKGVPAKPSGWLCACGSKLSFSRTPRFICPCGKAYNRLSSRQIVCLK